MYTVLQIRDLLHREIDDFYGTDSSWFVHDSSSFQLVESHAGNHQVYRPDNSPLTEVFAFARDFTDTTSVLKFRQVGPESLVTFQSDRPGGDPGIPGYHSLFTFRSGVGLVRRDYRGGFIDAGLSIDQALVDFTITSVGPGPGAEQPLEAELGQNYPNPFNPTTVVSYQLPAASNVRLVVYDLIGREVSVLVNERKEPGSYTAQFNASGLASGVYFYRLTAGSVVDTKKLILLR